MLGTLKPQGLFPSLRDPFTDETQAHSLPELPAIRTSFVLPQLREDGVARGILELSQRKAVSLADSPQSSDPPCRSESLPDHKRDVKVGRADLCEKELDGLDFWSAAAAFPPGSVKPPKRVFKTWSSEPLQPVNAGSAPSPFLSEAGVNLMDAVLPEVDPKQADQYVSARTVSSIDALQLLMASMLGTTQTAQLKWDPELQRFAWFGRVIGLDTLQSADIAQTFLDVATCLRRLEILVEEEHGVAQTSTHHALYHALSTYLSYIRQRLERASAQRLLEATSKLRDAACVLKALCELMNWPLGSAIAQPLSTQPVKILNTLHAHLASHLLVPTRVATPVQLATAYLLDKASQPWLDTLHRWVGLRPTSDEDESSTEQPWSTIGVEQTKAVAGHWEYRYHPKRMPAVVPKAQGRMIFEAGRSLRLLARATDGQHGLLGKTFEDVFGTWPWARRQEVDLDDHLRNVRRSLARPRTTLPLSQPDFDLVTAPAAQDAPQLAAAPLYARRELQDLDKPLEENPLWKLMTGAPQMLGDRNGPTGQLQGAASGLWQSSSSFDQLMDFLESHAGKPLLSTDNCMLGPAVETTLLAPSIAHGSLASQSLLTYFLQDLKLLEHLAILRAFFLGGDVSFSERVRVALFGDGQVDGQAVGVGRRARTRMRLGFESVGAQAQGRQSESDWGVGLAIGLSDRQNWPPGGAELSYALRTTLVDVEEKSASRGAGDVSAEVWQQVDERLSFAVRDLEQGDEKTKARWMDPQAIEALDFLYLSYDPPTVMNVLLTPDILGKYQTVFGFLLRLSRVETVLRSIYNDMHHLVPAEEQPIKQGVDTAQTSRRSQNPFGSKPRVKHHILAAHPATQAMLHRLRFRMTHLVTALSQYVSDTAIARNWDIFTRRLERLKLSSQRSTEDEDDGFGLDEDPDEGIPGGEIKDIHALVLYHHHVLDRILKGGLLGSSAGQQAMHRILMGLFRTALDVAKVVKEVAMRHVGKEDGAARLDKLNAAWIEREGMLLHALEKLSARSGVSRCTDDQDDDLAALLRGEDNHSSVLVDGGLGELLLRLQLGRPREST